MTQIASRLSSTLVSYWVDRQRTWAWVIAPDGTVTHHAIAIGEGDLTRRVRAAWALPDGQPTSRGGEPQAGSAEGGEGTAASGAGARRDVPAAWVPLTRGGGRLVVDASARRAARALYDLLIAPLRSALPRAPGSLLTVVPHGPLHRLSFAGLAAPSGRYLVEDFRLHYAASVGVLRGAPPPRPSRDGSRVLLVADPRLPPDLARRADLPPLPGALAEGRAVAREVGPASVVALTGRFASESRVRHEAGTARVLHFATHGVMRDDSPFDSFLALAAGDTRDPGDDARLTTAEVYDLSLDADLVVLSACRSASGPVTGDGVMGLTRAFVYAGTPSVVASLWDLPDEAARMAIPVFYRAWRATGDRAGALRTAQLHLLRALRAGRVAVDTPAGRLTLPEHPAIWAGLVLYGVP
jgi:CHAT domain-containing protein